ncbi:GMC oxidoreductase [Xylaria sp. CBS 124048]|nr:GMC oxidoreductase [Xylaria sp. CBS 124048]
MGLYKTLSDDIEEVDFIIVGGGTTACVVATRLTVADPSLSILVIEQGPDNYNEPMITTPGMLFNNFLPGSRFAQIHRAGKSEHIAGRELIVPSGSVLGGGSSINFMVYTRGQRDDFDAWDATGWSADELFPFIKKLETYHGSERDEATHGYHGPVQISDGLTSAKRVVKEILRAAEEVGYPTVPDLQTLDVNNAWAPLKRYITLEGKRSDAAHMYLHPVLRDGRHPKLHVLVQSQVIRLLFDKDKRAYGVEYRANPFFQDKDAPVAPVPTRTVRARKQVLMAAGPFGTPQILERSGIGNPEILKRAGVPVLVDLPGVGENYQDHHTMSYLYKATLEDHEDMTPLLSGKLSLEEALRTGDPRVGWNSIDASGKVRPTDEEVEALGPEFKAAWDRDFRNKPNRPLVYMAVYLASSSSSGLMLDGNHISISMHAAYPYSRGHIHITGPGLDDAEDFDSGFFGDPGHVDRKMQLWAYKKGREIMRRLSMYRGENQLTHPPFPPTSPAYCRTLDDGEAYDHAHVEDLAYTADDDRIIEQFASENVLTTFHALGTAKMGPRDAMGVVDNDLNVYGVKGLKIVDISIAPMIVAANTGNTAFAIGEKAADIVLRELRASKSK